MNELPEVNQNVNEVLNSVSFDEGYAYSDYVNGDKIASWTVGGLVAGKILAKTGFLAVLVKLWKMIAVAVIGIFSFVWKKIREKKTKNKFLQLQNQPQLKTTRIQPINTKNSPYKTSFLVKKGGFIFYFNKYNIFNT